MPITSQPEPMNIENQVICNFCVLFHSMSNSIQGTIVDGNFCFVDSNGLTMLIKFALIRWVTIGKPHLASP